MPRGQGNGNGYGHGYVIAKAESHGPHFLGIDGTSWTPALAMARVFSDHYSAERTRIRVQAGSVLDLEMAQWLKPAVIRVGVLEHLRR